eukprot:TRINITY_DN47044_c0_g1_i1.p1 TRINITY_DN47044_c0_g1~~TRINITY_DN47044_c0_g1_i1.p1  ORF type:complete len:934 (+),score=235.41 TRINITY_DN47044_c0_g1_i1:51-2804(+)
MSFAAVVAAVAVSRPKQAGQHRGAKLRSSSSAERLARDPPQSRDGCPPAPVFVVMAAVLLLLAVRCMDYQRGPTPSQRRGPHLAHSGQRRAPWNPVIPTVIHQTWVNTSIPRWATRPVSSWREQNPHYTYRLWTDPEMDVYMREHFPHLVDVWAASRPIERADIFRYAVLLRDGGVYSDLDVSCLIPVDEWASEYRSFGNPIRLIAGLEVVTGNRSDWYLWWSRRFQMVQWTIAAAPGHPVLARALRRIGQLWRQKGRSLFGNRSANVMESTGPGVWSDAVSDHLKEQHGAVLGEKPFDSQSMQDLGAHVGDALVLPVKGFAGTGDAPKAGCRAAKGGELVRHHFQGSWKDESQPAPSPSTSGGPVYRSDSRPPTGFVRRREGGLWNGAQLVGEGMSPRECADRCLDVPNCTAATTVVPSTGIVGAGTLCPTYDCGNCHLFTTKELRNFTPAVRATTFVRDAASSRVAGFRRHASGYWENTGAASPDKNVSECAALCNGSDRCRAFEVFLPPGQLRGNCYTFVDKLVEPFTSLGDCQTYVKVASSDVPDGFWRRSVGGHWENHGEPHPNHSIDDCASQCRGQKHCKGFEVYLEPAKSRGDCYLFRNALVVPFTENVNCHTFIKNGVDATEGPGGKQLHANLMAAGIPRVVHQMHASTKLPHCGPRGKWLQSWTGKNPGWSHVLWNDPSLRRVVAAAFPDFLRIYDSYPTNVQRSDAARVVLMYAYGGVYADVDFEALQSFDSLRVQHDAFFAPEPTAHAFLRKGGIWACNALLASVPRHPFWQFYVEEMVRAWKDPKVDRGDVLGTTGPAMLHQVYVKWVGGEASKRGSNRSVTMLPSEDLYPEIAKWNADIKAACRDRNSDLCADRYTNTTVAVHHWQCSWCKHDPCYTKSDIRSIVPEAVLGQDVLAATRTVPRR